MAAAKINPAKLKQDADKLEKSGQLEKAIVLYRQVVDDNPTDWNTINKVGDLYAKLNRNREASVEYAKVADYYAKDGFLLKAIAIWKKINKLDSTALEPYVNLAELYAKQGLMMEAKGQYQIIVDEYVRRGKLKDAGEILRRMADIDPTDLKIRSKLADLYTREGNSGKAIEEHIAIADELNKKGHLAEALQVLEKGLKIGPQNPRLRAELARIHLLQKNYDKAVHFLEEAVQHAPNDVPLLTRLGEAYLGAKKIEEAQSVFRRLLELNPADQEARVQMGRLCLLQGQFDRAFDELLPVIQRLLDQREPDRAVVLLQQITKGNPNHVKSLVKIAEIYKSTGKESPATAAYSHLTEAYIKEGQLEQAASILEMLLNIDPQNQQHRNKLDWVRRETAARRGGPAAATAPSAPAPFELEEEEFDLDQPVAPVATPAPARRAAPQPAAMSPGESPYLPTTPIPRPTIEVTGPLTPEEKEFLDEHMGEGRVFRKYGLLDKALDQFEAIVARFPDNVEARRELVDLYRERGTTEKAAEHGLALAEAYRLKGDEAAAETCETEARRLLPQAAAAPTRATPTPAAARHAAPDPVPQPKPRAERETTEEIPLDFEELGAEEPAGASAPTETVLEGLDFGGDEEELPARFLDEAPAPHDIEEFDVSLPLEPATAPPDPPRAAAPEPELADIGLSFPEEPSASEEFELPLPEPVQPTRSAASRATPAPLPEPEPELGLSLEEPAPLEELGLPLGDGDDLLGSLGAPEPPEPTPAPRPAVDQMPPVARAPAFIATPPSTPEAGLEDILGGGFGAPEADLSEPALPADLQRVLADVDQSLAFGFVDEAKEALRAIGMRYPGHPAILEKIGLLGVDQEAPPAVELEEEVPFGGPAEELPLDLEEPEPGPSPLEELDELSTPEPAAEPSPFDSLEEIPLPEPEPEPPAEEGFDLGAALGGMFGAQSAVEEPPLGASTDLGDPSLAKIFEEFKRGVDQQLGQEDYDTRYNLGIAYKEMGLVDEAIAEFQLAAKDEARLLECASMLGLCFAEKGMPKLAVKWFEKGLKAQGRKEEEYNGLRYDLATAYESAGEPDTALRMFSELFSRDSSFRDVATKIRTLRSSLGR